MPEYNEFIGLCKRCGLPIIWGGAYSMHQKTRDVACNLQAEDSDIKIDIGNFECNTRNPCYTSMQLITAIKFLKNIDNIKLEIKLVEPRCGIKSNDCPIIQQLIGKLSPEQKVIYNE